MLSTGRIICQPCGVELETQWSSQSWNSFMRGKVLLCVDGQGSVLVVWSKEGFLGGIVNVSCCVTCSSGRISVLPIFFKIALMEWSAGRLWSELKLWAHTWLTCWCWWCFWWIQGVEDYMTCGLYSRMMGGKNLEITWAVMKQKQKLSLTRNMTAAPLFPTVIIQPTCSVCRCCGHLDTVMRHVQLGNILPNQRDIQIWSLVYYLTKRLG